MATVGVKGLKLFRSQDQDQDCKCKTKSNTETRRTNWETGVQGLAKSDSRPRHVCQLLIISFHLSINKITDKTNAVKQRIGAKKYRIVSKEHHNTASQYSILIIKFLFSRTDVGLRSLLRSNIFCWIHHGLFQSVKNNNA